MMKDLYLVKSCNVSGRDARQILHCVMLNLSILLNVPVWLIKSRNGVCHREYKQKHREGREEVITDGVNNVPRNPNIRPITPNCKMTSKLERLCVSFNFQETAAVHFGASEAFSATCTQRQSFYPIIFQLNCVPWNLPLAHGTNTATSCPLFKKRPVSVVTANHIFNLQC